RDRSIKCFRLWVQHSPAALAGTVRAVLHMINEGPQLRGHLPIAGIEEEDTRHNWRKRLQQVHELSRIHRTGSDRRGHLRKAQSSESGAKHRWNVVGDKRS